MNSFRKSKIFEDFGSKLFRSMSPEEIKTLFSRWERFTGCSSANNRRVKV